jgi:hypothetical protein
VWGAIDDYASFEPCKIEYESTFGAMWNKMVDLLDFPRSWVYVSSRITELLNAVGIQGPEAKNIGRRMAEDNAQRVDLQPDELLRQGRSILSQRFS